MELKGIVNRIAVIDLSKGEIRYESLTAEMIRNYIGGYGFGAYFILKRQAPGVDPLGAEAWLGFTTGPLTGTDACGGNRFTVVGKSPKTGGWGDANCGGKFGPFMKMAGFDYLFFKGIADEPVIVVLGDGAAEIRPAGDLWGLGCIATEERLETEHGPRASVACIGPAGENVSLLACVINDRGRAAGRSGLGAVMGAKKIKAIVAKKTGQVPVADPEGLKALRQELLAYYKDDNGAYELFHNFGTPGVTEPTTLMGDGPIKNWAGTIEDFPTLEKIGGDAVIAMQDKPYGCWKCPVACGGHVIIKKGRLKGTSGHKPEYETLGAFGSLCLNDDLDSIVVVNNLCNDYGTDTISTGTTVAFAMELYDKGIVSKEDLGGLDLSWGNSKAIIALTRQLVSAQGPGAKLFGNGQKAAIEMLGEKAAECATHAGGEELPMHDPRCKPGLGSSYVIDATPGRHTQWSAWNVEDGFVPEGLNPPESEKFDYANKGPTHKVQSCYGHSMNSAGLCWFVNNCGFAEALPRGLSLATGQEFSMEDMQIIGARIAALRMCFNAREGVCNPVDYKLPGRVVGDPPPAAGPNKGVAIDNPAQINSYLKAMGWNSQTGYPTDEALRSLGLEWVIELLAAGTL